MCFEVCFMTEDDGLREIKKNEKSCSLHKIHVSDKPNNDTVSRTSNYPKRFQLRNAEFK